MLNRSSLRTAPASGRKPLRAVAPLPPLDPVAILSALPAPVLVVDGGGRIAHANAAAEDFFQAGGLALRTLRLDDLIPGDSPVHAVLAVARAKGTTISEYGVALETPRLGSHVVTVQVAPLLERPGHVVLMLTERTVAQKIDRQLTHRNAARSVTAMAAILAHEVKNPLSGIRGAAQLLEENASDADRELTRLICDEADRIVALVDRVEAFSDPQPLEPDAVNIHEVLERVRRLAQTGFGRHVRFIEEYDPSLPPVRGHHDSLVQVFLNLVKNAAEAVPRSGGEVVLTTAYQQGVRLAVGGTEGRIHLPLVVSVIDNGDGIPEDLRAHLFDPFVTTKPKGTGLGLALVAKIVGDHGGVIEFESQPRRTVFRVHLPTVSADGVTSR